MLGDLQRGECVDPRLAGGRGPLAGSCRLPGGLSGVGVVFSIPST